MYIRKPDNLDSTHSLAETILKWILSNIKGTSEHTIREMYKHIKY